MQCSAVHPRLLSTAGGHPDIQMHFAVLEAAILCLGASRMCLEAECAASDRRTFTALQVHMAKQYTISKSNKTKPKNIN